MALLKPALQEIDKIREKDIIGVCEQTEETLIVPYRDWEKKEKPAVVYKIPIEYCKYRVDNGRIITQVLTHKKKKGELNPDDVSTQELLASFLADSDRAQNENLKKKIKIEGQKEAAIITADGFLINGNRRKMVLEQLNKENPNKDYQYLKVVRLPGTDNSALRPTIADIALLENRYQVYTTGKSEYTLMNKIMTLYKNEKNGIPLSQMLADDPTYAALDEKKLVSAIKKFRRENFEPLELMMQYLEENNLKDDYVKVADKWSSFQEYSKIINPKLKDAVFREDNSMREQDIGLIQSAAFNVIKLKEHDVVGSRTNEIIRKFPEWIGIDKNELYKIGRIEDTKKDIQDPDEKYNVWNDDNKEEILNSLKKLKGLSDKKKDQEGPIKKLEEIMKKLEDEKLALKSLTFMPTTDLPDALKIANKIQTRINYVVQLLYYVNKGDEYKIESLLEKFNKE